VFATGASQTAFYLNTYAANFASSARLAPDDPFRMYEMAGTAHGWSDIYNYQPPFEDIAAAGGVPVTFVGCAEAKCAKTKRPPEGGRGTA
jgi:hypothetical protein